MDVRKYFLPHSEVLWSWPNFLLFAITITRFSATNVCKPKLSRIPNLVLEWVILQHMSTHKN